MGCRKQEKTCRILCGIILNPSPNSYQKELSGIVRRLLGDRDIVRMAFRDSA